MSSGFAPLRPGDTIGFVCASSPVLPEILDVTVSYYEEMGFSVLVGESCRSRDGFLAGSDELRAKELNGMFKNPAVKAIFCVRGGYGSARILDKLDYAMICKNSKIFAGYSDVTALHCALQKNCGLLTFHSPMPAEMASGLDEFSLKSYASLVLEQKFPDKICNPVGYSLTAFCGGKAKGRLFGGNLTVLASLCGTCCDWNAYGKILFLEEIGESPYRIDRLLTQLHSAGKFRDCCGILLGSFTDCLDKDNTYGKTAEETLYESLREIGKPVISGLCCGHMRPTLSLPLGAEIFLDADNREISIC